MSWLYTPGQVVASLPQNGYSTGAPSATSKETNTPSTLSRPASGTATSTTPQSGQTLEHSTGDPGVDAWILSLRASRANRFLQQENGKVLMTNGTAGLTPFVLLKKSSQGGFSWRTPQTCFRFNTRGQLLHTSNKLLVSWPQSGMWDGGAAYRLPLWEATTNGNGCGLLPTPLATDGRSFYKVTQKTALRIMDKKKQLHWMHYGVVWHDLKKGWANPQFSEMMMGWPIGWTDLKPLEMDKFQQWLAQFGK